MFTKRYKLFDLLGFPIYLDMSWFAIVILISWSLATTVFPGQVPGLSRATYCSMGVAGAMGLFAPILAHELGHAVVARRFDLHIRSITLLIVDGERLVGLLSLSDLKKFIALKVELDDDSANNLDSLPRREHADLNNGSSKTIRDEIDQAVAEARLL